MKCPYCGIEFHFEEHDCIPFAYELDDIKGHISGYGISTCFCPSCENLIVLYVEGKYDENEYGTYLREPYVNIKILLPTNYIGKVVPEEVPLIYKEDFEEASNLVTLSPKASAALSRRALQRFLHEHIGIKKRSLAQEIQEFINNEQLPTYLLDAVDAIRNIGNFAAHPLKDTNTGEIVDVEVGEAEWLLEVLEMLFDFYFVQPEKLKKRQVELDNKLKTLGKPPMSKISCNNVR